jgi:hypothetical protein
MICEQLSRHGDLMRDLAEIGLSPENCEQWFERAVLVFVGVMFIIIVLRVSKALIFATNVRSELVPVFDILPLS